MPDLAIHLGRADEITIVGDEEGFELHFTTDEGERYVLNVHGVAHLLHLEVRTEIGRWLDEGLAARASRPVTDDNAKHSLHTDYWDLREKGA